jgi:cyclohexadieny/prephenate dehydrogenase
MVVLGTPPGALGHVAATLAPGLDEAAVVTDVGSVKAIVVEAVHAALPRPERFVGGHPVAGTEHSGPDAAFASLFRGRRCILTPTPATAPAATARVRAMWEAVGASVDEMDPAHHDRILAITSHLPHLIAYTIVGTVADLEEQVQSEVFKYAAGGFTDFTRIAASDPVMWRDVFLNNKEATIEMLGRFTEDLIALQRAIRWDQGDVLEHLFTRTRTIRRGVVAAGQAYVRQPEDPLATEG